MTGRSANLFLYSDFEVNPGSFLQFGGFGTIYPIKKRGRSPAQVIPPLVEVICRNRGFQPSLSSVIHVSRPVGLYTDYGSGLPQVCYLRRLRQVS